MKKTDEKEYILKISAIHSDEERMHRIDGNITDVYQYMKESCTVCEVADIYEQEVYKETVIRLPASVAKIEHYLEW